MNIKASWKIFIVSLYILSKYWLTLTSFKFVIAKNGLPKVSDFEVKKAFLYEFENVDKNSSNLPRKFSTVIQCLEITKTKILTLIFINVSKLLSIVFFYFSIYYRLFMWVDEK